MAFSHLYWQLSHLGKGEAVLSTQDGGQDALFIYLLSLWLGFPLPPPPRRQEAWQGCHGDAVITLGEARRLPGSSASHFPSDLTSLSFLL